MWTEEGISEEISDVVSEVLKREFIEGTKVGGKHEVRGGVYSIGEFGLCLNRGALFRFCIKEDEKRGIEDKRGQIYERERTLFFDGERKVVTNRFFYDILSKGGVRSMEEEITIDEGRGIKIRSDLTMVDEEGKVIRVYSVRPAGLRYIKKEGMVGIHKMMVNGQAKICGLRRYKVIYVDSFSYDYIEIEGEVEEGLWEDTKKLCKKMWLCEGYYMMKWVEGKEKEIIEEELRKMAKEVGEVYPIDIDRFKAIPDKEGYPCSSCGFRIREEEYEEEGVGISLCRSPWRRVMK
ncbi:MAG: hypothetical protein QW052_06235 [Candidatus Nitrosocaldaceae archaeon]